MTDLRSASRARTYVGGRIAIADAPPLRCLVRDLSATGARLVTARANDLPPLFRLSVPRIGLSIQVQRIWTKGDICGVRFISVPTRRMKGSALALDGK